MAAEQTNGGIEPSRAEGSVPPGYRAPRLRRLGNVARVTREFVTVPGVTAGGNIRSPGEQWLQDLQKPRR